jgi:hypothetical protein
MRPDMTVGQVFARQFLPPASSRCPQPRASKGRISYQAVDLTNVFSALSRGPRIAPRLVNICVVYPAKRWPVSRVAAEASVFSPQPPSQGPRGRSRADAGADPFSTLLNSARPGHSAEPRSEPSPRGDKTAKPHRPEAAAKAPKPCKDTQDAKKPDHAEVTAEAKDAPGTTSDSKQPATSASADGDKDGNPCGDGDAEPTLFTAEALASQTANAAAVPALPVPVPAPAIPPASIAALAGVNETAISAASAVVGAVAFAPDAAPAMAPAADTLASATVAETVAAPPAIPTITDSKLEGSQRVQAPAAVSSTAFPVKVVAHPAPVVSAGVATKTDEAPSAPEAPAVSIESPAASMSAETVAAPGPAAALAVASPAEAAIRVQTPDTAPAISAEIIAPAAPASVLVAAAAKPETSQSAPAPDAARRPTRPDQAATIPRNDSTDTAEVAAGPASDPAAANARGKINSPDIAEADGKSLQSHAEPAVSANAHSHAELRPELRVVDGEPNSAPQASINPSSNPSLSPASATTANAATNIPQAASNAAPTALVPISGLAIEIAARIQTGKSRFEIRLDPPELGRIDVRLDVDRHGNVSSHLRVDRAETLDLLMRDAPNLERAFQQAGLKSSDDGLQFSLRDQAFSGRDTGGQTTPAMAQLVVPDDQLSPVETMQRGYRRHAGLGGGVDIRV